MGNITYDVFVIGSGSAGQEVATSCAKQGLKVGMADDRAYGGTCANRGCDPKKVLITVAGVLDAATRFRGLGVEKLPQISWRNLQQFKKQFTDNIPISTEENLRDLSIDLYHQSPKFIDKQTLSVEGKTVKAKYYVIATGQRPKSLPIPGADLAKNSDEFLKLDRLPQSAAFIGAGYIGLEFSHLLNRLGCNVTIFERSSEILSKFDPDMAAILRQRSEKMGIRFYLDAEVEKFEKLRKNHRITYNQGNDSSTVDVEMIFNTAGREPAVEPLNLTKGEVKMSPDGVSVDEYLQSKTNAQVYACGDVSDHSVALTPLSGYEGTIVSENILQGNTTMVDVSNVPSTVFTYPNMAKVGLMEKEAQARYKNIRISTGDAKDWYNGRRENQEAYSYKIIMNQRTDEIVGAHIVGPDAAETINLFTMAINTKMTARELKDTMFTYPSMGYDIKHMV